jgi:type II secretory pathway predicted ATPase ExeA
VNRKDLAQVGLKWDPFANEVPLESIYVSQNVESFYWRVEHSLVREGGYAWIRGDSGNGKSTALRVVEDRLRRMADVNVGSLQRPSSGVADLYREMGELFGLELRPSNRWCGFKTLRERWQAHIDSTAARPILLIDEAQDFAPAVLNELRFLASTRLDSRIILAVIFAADSRFEDKLAERDLIPMAGRIRIRLLLDRATPEELMAHLKHLVTSAGNAKLMTPELMKAICDHSLGNLRAMTSLCAELLAAAIQSERGQLDEKLFLDLNKTAQIARTTARRPRLAAGGQ